MTDTAIGFANATIVWFGLFILCVLINHFMKWYQRNYSTKDRDITQHLITIKKLTNERDHWLKNYEAERSYGNMIDDRIEKAANVALAWFEQSPPLFTDRAREEPIHELNELLKQINRPRNVPVALIEAKIKPENWNFK